MKYLYIQENKDWNSENKFKYGYTENPKNRLTSEQHSHKSSYIALYECYETDKYNDFYHYQEYDKIISILRHKNDKEITEEEIDNGVDLSSFKEIKKYLINNGGGTEFIYSNEGIELLDYIFINIFKDIGINTRKLSKDEINAINEMDNKKDNDDYIDYDIIKKKNNKIKLRNYQIDIIEYGINSLIKNKNNKFYLELATGAGKSTIIYNILNNIILKNKDNYYTIIIFTPRINISTQNINHKYINIFKNKFNIYDNNKIKRIKTFNNNSYNIISCCIQSYQFIYDNIITKFNINNIIIWFDEAHYTIESWIKLNNHYKQFYLTDNERIIYRLFTSASPNKEIVKNNYDIFGELYSPISVRNLIKDNWLAPIKPHIMELDEMNDDDEDENNENENNKKIRKYYTNTILNVFQKFNKNIGLNFHNSCKNAKFAFLSHFNKYINTNTNTNIKPYLLISNENINSNLLEYLDKYSNDINDYKKLLNFEEFHNENNNAIAYIVNMYNMGYDNPKIDFLSFADPKLSNKDIIQSIGRGIRPDGLGEDGKNELKINDIIIPIYNNTEETDKYIKFTKIKEILQYLIYDIGLDIKDFNIYNKSKNKLLISSSIIDYEEELDESKIIANIIKWDIEPKIEKWNISKITIHLMNNKIHNYNDYLEYISLKENKELNLPLDLFKTYSNFNFNNTYKNNSSPYYNRDECIEAIKKYKNDFIDNDDIDKNDNNDIIKFLNEIDKKIPNFLLWYYYGGSIKDYILFI
jgi:superfamily II DNA or RNA helicase